MLRRVVKRLSQIYRAFHVARQAGRNRAAALVVAASPSKREAFLKLEHTPCPMNGVIVDVGANRGQMLGLLLARFEPQRAIAVEPLPGAFADLEAHFREHPHVHLFRCALGAVPGEANLQVNWHDQASSVLPIRTEGDLRFTQRDLTPVAEIAVPMRTLDEIAGECDLEIIDLLKIDVQGYELEVLRGAEGILPATRTILAEVSFYEQYEGSALFWDLHRFLGERGFVLRWLGDYQTSADGVVLQADAVYVRHVD